MTAPMIAKGIWCNTEQIFTGEDQYADGPEPTECSNCGSSDIQPVTVTAEIPTDVNGVPNVSVSGTEVTKPI